MSPVYKFGILTQNVNLFVFSDPNNVTGYSISAANGNLRLHNGYNSTGYIDISGYSGIVISALWDSAFYDKNKQFISGIASTGGRPATIATPLKAVYIRVSISDADYNANTYTLFGISKVSPNYSSDLSKNYELESNQRFFRHKLSGSLTFIREDFDFINNEAFDTLFNLYMWRSNDLGVTWGSEFTGKFMKTDCTFDNDDKKITVQPDTIDEYNDVIAGLDKEFDLIAITPQIERILVQKRPLIQVYIPGDSIVSCFLGGTYWEQEANVVTDPIALFDTYHFGYSNVLKEINVTGSSNPNVNGLYAGRLSKTSDNIFSGTLYSNNNNGYYIRARQEYRRPYWGIIIYEIIRSSDNAPFFQYTGNASGQPFDNAEFDFVALSGATGSPHGEMATYNIYARYLLDVTTISGLDTYELPTDDIVNYNRNYRRAIGYALDIAFISNRNTEVPTEWGRRDDGTYFLPPYSSYGQVYYPIARSTWRYSSIWFGYYVLDQNLEVKGRKTYILRDNFPVSSVIQSLLNQFAPDITHRETQEYSKFLYSGNNPIVANENFRLFVTQKSNILSGNYQQPAQKALTTLSQFTNMLRDCFRCFWYIEDKKFKIEHISWFLNGGSYSELPQIGTDLTQLQNIRNGKTWGFSSSQYSFNKVDMPERYQFKWMDEVTKAFEGTPMQVISKYVTEGKIEDINVGNFTSDVDIMMLNPDSISNEGFGLFAAVNANALSNDDSGSYPGGTSGTNGLTTPTYGIRPECAGRPATLNFSPRSSNNSGTGRVVFYNSAGAVISTQGNFNADGTTQKLNLTIPTTATAIGLTVTGTVNAYLYSLIVPSQWELPFTTQIINGVNYYLQNGFLAFISLQPKYWIYDLPARQIEINGTVYTAKGIERNKMQTITYPMPDEPNLIELVKTYIGNGQIDKIIINLLSRSAQTTLKYDTE